MGYQGYMAGHGGAVKLFFSLSLPIGVFLGLTACVANLPEAGDTNAGATTDLAMGADIDKKKIMWRVARVITFK